VIFIPRAVCTFDSIAYLLPIVVRSQGRDRSLGSEIWRLSWCAGAISALHSHLVKFNKE